MHRFLINLPDDVFEQLRKEAFEDKVSISHYINGLLEARNDLTRLPEKVKTKIIKTIEDTPGLDNKVYGICKHGARKGLCKHGC